MPSVIKFRITERSEIYDHYHKQGYVVIKNAIPSEKIDAFIDSYKSIRKHPFFIYYSQSKKVCMRPALNKFSYITESMQNASRLAFFRNFSKTFQACIYDKNVSEALTILKREEKYVSWQDMFFDQSTGTIEHQDSWYLDTEPPGNLVGVWYALEDIHAESGPFFVVPGSHKIGLIDRNEFPEHNDFVCVVREKIAELSLKRRAMILDKSDILLWHPFLIHGAFNCINELLSRKSFTSHFYPLSCVAKDIEKNKSFSVYDHNNPRPTGNPNIYSAYHYHNYIYNTLVYGLYLRHHLPFMQPRISMRREDYAT